MDERQMVNMRTFGAALAGGARAAHLPRLLGPGEFEDGSGHRVASLADRMREDGIKARVTRLDGPPADDAGTDTGEGTDWWQVRLTRDGKSLTQAYGMGPGNLGQAPTGEDVLETLLLNVSGVTGSSGYRDWLSDYGLADTSQQRRTYRRNVRLTDRMKRFLGDKFDTYLYDTDR